MTDPDIICACEHFSGFQIEEFESGHRADGSCMECDCKQFREDSRATLYNWMAEEGTW